MSASELCLRESASSANNPMQPRSQDHVAAVASADQTEQPSLQVVKVPTKIIFNQILDHLSLPRAQYKLCPSNHHKIRSTVIFYASTHVPGEVLQRIEIQGALSVDPEIADESAALEGIRHMENWENVVVEELNYSELKYVQAENKELRAKTLSVYGSVEKSIEPAAAISTRICIHKHSVLEHALQTLSLKMHEAKACALGNNQVLGSVSIDVPAHGQYPSLHKRTFYGDYKLTEEDALESAKLAALLYFQEIGIIIVDDINLAKLTKCEVELADCQRKLLAASSYAIMFQERAESAQAELATANKANEKLVAASKAFHAKAETLTEKTSTVKQETTPQKALGVQKELFTPPECQRHLNTGLPENKKQRIFPAVSTRRLLFQTSSTNDSEAQSGRAATTDKP